MDQALYVILLNEIDTWLITRFTRVRVHVRLACVLAMAGKDVPGGIKVGNDTGPALAIDAIKAGIAVPGTFHRAISRRTIIEKNAVVVIIMATEKEGGIHTGYRYRAIDAVRARPFRQHNVLTSTAPPNGIGIGDEVADEGLAPNAASWLIVLRVGQQRAVDGGARRAHSAIRHRPSPAWANNTRGGALLWIICVLCALRASLHSSRLVGSAMTQNASGA